MLELAALQALRGQLLGPAFNLAWYAQGHFFCCGPSKGALGFPRENKVDAGRNVEQISVGRREWALRPKTNATKDEAAAQGPESDLTEVVAAKLESLGRTEAEIAELVRAKVRDTLRAAGSVATDAVGVARSASTEALRAAQEVGGLLITARAAAKGVVLGVADVGGDTAAAAGAVVRAAIEAAGRMGADVAAVARRAVDGVVEAAGEVGGQTADVAKAAAVAAVEAAGGLGDAALAVVKDLMGTIAVGIRDIADLVLRKAPAKRQRRLRPAHGRARRRPRAGFASRVRRGLERLQRRPRAKRPRHPFAVPGPASWRRAEKRRLRPPASRAAGGPSRQPEG